MLPRSGVQLLEEKKQGTEEKNWAPKKKKQGFGLTEVGVAVVAKSIVAIVT